MLCCVPMNLPNSDDYYYKKYDPVDDFLSMPNADELIQKGDFFKDRKTINFSLEQAKDNESFNAVMIEKAYFLVNGDNVYTEKPVFSQIDMANIIALKASKLLQEGIDKRNSYYVTAGALLDHVIAENFSDVRAIDINNSDWVANNRLAKAMKSCIKDNHDQTNINAVISDRVIQYYQHINQGDSFLGCDPKVLTNALLSTIFNFQTQITSYADDKGFFSELTASGDKRTINKRECMVFPDYG